MLDDPQHHLPWRERRAFYEALGDDVQARRLRGWLAILSAQHVLPIVLSTTPWDAQPLQNLDAAIRFLQGEPYPLAEGPEISAEQVIEASYHADSDAYDPLTDMYRADIGRASAATHKALLEATGRLDSFKTTKYMHGRRENGFYFRGLALPDNQILGDDEDWSIFVAVGDAAGAAAVASACTSERSACDPAKLRAFWEWWLYEALPRAAQIIKYGPG